MLVIDDRHHEITWLDTIVHLLRRYIMVTIVLLERVLNAITVNECSTAYETHRSLALHHVS